MSKTKNLMQNYSGKLLQKSGSWKSTPMMAKLWM